MRRVPALAPLAIVAAVLAAGAVAAIAGLTGGHAIMPGALHGPGHEQHIHGRVSSHAEIDDCEGCHPGPFADRAASDLCLGCHDDIAKEILDPSRRHGRVKATGRCIQCHTEHRGTDAELNRVDRDHFDHDASGFSLLAHKKTKAGGGFRCGTCHTQDTDHFAPATCVACHRADDAEFMTRHIGAWGDRCLACHDGVDRFDDKLFDHARTTFALVGKHVTTACERCHTNVRQRADFRRAEAACKSCHAADDVHRGRLGDDCAHCHTAETWKKVVPGGFDHQTTRFPLTGAHQKVACADCHWQGRLFGTPRDCEGCHTRPRNHYAGECAQCHDTTRWNDAKRPAPTLRPTRPTPTPTPIPMPTPKPTPTPTPTQPPMPTPRPTPTPEPDATTQPSPRHR